MNASADFQLDQGVLRFRGELTLARIGDLPQRLAGLGEVPSKIDLEDVDRVDTVGAWLVHRIARENHIEVVGADEDVCQLLEQIGEADKPVKIRPDASPPLIRVMREIGDATAAAWVSLLGLLGFFGATLIGLWGLVTHPRRFRYNAMARQFEVVGVKALAIIGLMSFLIGIVIAQQGAVQLRQFGAEVFAVNLIGRITLRELGVLMTAIMVAGRSGSAFAAQLGSMKLAEEVDAMRTIGVSPMEALILPRVLATVVLMPLLGFYAAVIAIIGGGIFCWIDLDIPPVTFIQRIREVVPMTDLWVGLIKAPVFGMLIALCGCYQGMQVEGNAEEVGLRTTASVVQAIFLVIVLDAVFAVFFSSIGWI
ncbi:ABC transporter permease [Rhizorhabdus dicambivorans]|uniref:ABC transporter permease n=1 Tax=Rhizorhabdus dicambivorans TaxID=1850238 RepID=A0A2A4G0B3_9SPHN|nr:MlaE family lipid ABC transporter permease subunit [Rhizorhabdus dicambivorans]ATE63238.1 ABC transporter permease [Rhizorhabdus dicambivorans]PCE43449.1 ABC transporter permease [Rhizorhabdus dicambivorans]